MGMKISALTTASALTGTEYLAIVQGGATVKVSLAALATFLGGTVSTPSTPATSYTPNVSIIKTAIQQTIAATYAGRAIATWNTDSEGVGEGGSDSSANNYNTNCNANSMAMAFAATMAAGGVPCNANGHMGDGGCAQYGDVYQGIWNTQIGYHNSGTTAAQWFTTGFDPDTGKRSSLGGSPHTTFHQLAAGADDGAYLSFAPAGVMPNGGTTDRLRIVVQRTAVAGLAVSRDGGAPTSLTITPGDEGFAILDWAADRRAAQSYYFNASPSPQNAAVVVQGMYAYDSQTPAIDIVNCSMRGSKVAHWIRDDGPHSYNQALAALAPKLSIVGGVNDCLGSTPIATFKANLTTFVTTRKTTGTVVIINPPAMKADGLNNRPTQATRDTYTAAMRQVAQEQGCLFVDLEQLLGPWNANDWRDEVHPKKAIYLAAGQAIASSLLAALALQPGTPTLTVTGGAATAEGNSGTTTVPIGVTLNRNGVTVAQPYTWAITGIGANPANAADFAAMSGSGTIAAGATTDSFNIGIVGDAVVEPNETYRVTVTLTNYSGVSASTDGTITNDDSAAVFDANTRGLIVVVGDSIMQNGESAIEKAFKSYPNIVINKQYAASGTQLRQAVSTDPTAAGAVANGVGQLYDPARTCTAVIQRCTNDLFNFSNTQMKADVATLIQRFRSQGFRVVVDTCLPKGTASQQAAYASNTSSADYAVEQQRLAWNDIVRANDFGGGVSADAIIDLTTNPTMGPPSASTNTTYYADGVHPTDAGNEALKTSYFDTPLKTVLAGGAVTPTATPPLGARQALYSPVRVRAGEILPDAISYAAGKFGQGLTSSQLMVPGVSVPPTPLLPMRIELWIKIANGQDANGTTWIKQGKDPGNGTGWALYSAYSRPMIFLTKVDGTVETQQAGTQINDGVPHHIALEFSTAGCSLFLDGALAASTATVLPVSAISLPLWINPTAGTGNTAANSVIDELAVFSALKGAAAPPTATYTGSEANLLALYHLDGNLNDSRA